MELGSLLIVIFLFILSGLFILRPFFVHTGAGGRAGTTIRDSLVAERERLLHAIEEIDLEYELDKISPEEHTRNRDILLSEAAIVLKELDDLPKSGSAKRKKAAPVQKEDDLEIMIADRRKQLKGEISLKCPRCGESVEKGASFCSHCGGAL
jgi:hypothetical protein